MKPHPLHHLTPVDITEPGHVISVSVSAHMAGTLPGKIVHQLAQSARQLVSTCTCMYVYNMCVYNMCMYNMSIVVHDGE